MTIFNDVVLALSKSVPELDGLVSGGRDDLTVIGRERDTQDIVGVSNKALSGGTSVQVPQTKSLVPRGRQGKLTIRGDDNVRDKVVVTSKGFARNTIVLLVPSQVPDDDRLVWMR